MILNKDDLNTILKKHKKWLNKEKGGDRADLRGADLRYANLQRANLRYADLQGANLLGVNLQDANLLEANLLEANLQGANLRYANLRGANLQGASLLGANLQVASLLKVNLQGADLRYANLQGADLRGADLRYADLHDVANKEIYTISNIGTYRGIAVYIPEIDTVFAGCWSGSLEGFLEKGIELNKYDEKELKKIELAYEFFKIHKEDNK